MTGPARVRPETDRKELWREATVMALYVSIVVLAALAALPSDYAEPGGDGGHSGPPVIAIVWGTSIGLALAHWFAFELAAVGFAAAFIPSLIIGLAGYRVARTRGRSVAASVVLSGVVLAAGVAVAVVKTALAGH